MTIPSSPDTRSILRSSSNDSRGSVQRQSLSGLRLHKHADYQRAYAGSRKRQSASMSWFLAPQPPVAASQAMSQSGPRVGLTAGKVLGKAHERNRIKRRIREALRRHRDALPQGYDLIFHPRRILLTIEFAKLEGEIVRILHQAKTEAAKMATSQAPSPATQVTLVKHEL